MLLVALALVIFGICCLRWVAQASSSSGAQAPLTTHITVERAIIVVAAAPRPDAPMQIVRGRVIDVKA